MNPETPTPQQIITPDPNPAPAPTPAPVPPQPPADMFAPDSPAPTPPPKKKKFGLLAMVVAGMLLLSATAAGAYYGVVLPNKPENKLAKAFENLADQDQITLTGTIDYSDVVAEGEDTSDVSIDFVSKTNLNENQLGLAGDIGVGGASFPFDVRFIDKDLYLKIGGLGSLDELGSLSANPEAAAYLSLLSQLNDQWYVVDRSFIDDAGEQASCFTDTSFALTDEDVNKIGAAYDKYPLFTIKNSSDAEVDGVATTKMELDPASNEVAADFAKELESLSVVQKIKDCVGEEAFDDATETTTTESTEEEEDATYVVYVDGNKQFKRLEITSNTDESEVKMVIDFNFDDVTIEKPEDAKPIQDILGELLGGSTVPAGADGPSQDELDVLFQ